MENVKSRNSVVQSYKTTDPFIKRNDYKSVVSTALYLYTLVIIDIIFKYNCTVFLYFHVSF